MKTIKQWEKFFVILLSGEENRILYCIWTSTTYLILKINIAKIQKSAHKSSDTVGNLQFSKCSEIWFC
jgi:hypothetical protein